MSLDYRYYKVWDLPTLDKDLFVETTYPDACCALPIWKDISYVLYRMLPGADYGGFHHYLSVCKMIFNRGLAAFAFRYLKLEPSHACTGLYVNFLTRIKEWSQLDLLEAVQNYLEMNQYFWGICRNAKYPASTPVEWDFAAAGVHWLIKCDFYCICYALEIILGSRRYYKQVMGLRGNQAQSLLDLLQSLVDCASVNPNVKRKFKTALIRLCAASGCYPRCLMLRGVEQLGPHALAGGSFGDVWKGVVRGQEVAIKALKVYMKSDVKEVLKHFSREVAIWGQLSHRNILPFWGVYHWRESTSQLCFVSPWMEDGTVMQYLRKVPDANRTLLALDVAQGLEYIHGLKPSVVHGDLKGANILITPSGVACLADFGLASAADSQALKWTSLSTAARSGGTLRWQAPELIGCGLGTVDDDRSVPSTTFSDIYAFACVCYEIFSGNVPFYEIKVDVAVYGALGRGRRPSRPSDPIIVQRGLDDNMWNLVQDCWDTDPTKRPDAIKVVNRILSRPNPPEDTRGPFSWDTDFPCILRASLESHMLCPSLKNIRELMDNQAPEIVEVPPEILNSSGKRSVDAMTEEDSAPDAPKRARISLHSEST